jgi:hypothetical protein
MRRRQSALRGVTRLHTPTPAEPLNLVVVDELASLPAYVTDRDAKKRIAAALSLLLSQGSAVGVTVVEAVQTHARRSSRYRTCSPPGSRPGSPRPTTWARTSARAPATGEPAATRFPEPLPGVGYVGIDSIAEPVRVRFTHVTDGHIARMVTDYAPGTQSHQSAGELPGSGLVSRMAPCSRLRGGGYRDHNNVEAGFRTVRSATKFEWVVPHVYRKTMATMLDQGGLSARMMADQLGHSRISMTQDVHMGGVPLMARSRLRSRGCSSRTDRTMKTPVLASRGCVLTRARRQLLPRFRRVGYVQRSVNQPLGRCPAVLWAVLWAPWGSNPQPAD